MKNNYLFICLLFVIGLVQLNAQIESIDDRGLGGKEPCVSFVMVEQDCNYDGTVDVTFLISNNTKCNASAVTIADENGIGQSYPIAVGGQTVSNVPITLSGLTPGSLSCFNVTLHGSKGRECCRANVCIEVDCCDMPGCCEMEAELVSIGGCDPNNQSARIVLSGGTLPYSGPSGSFYIGDPANWIVPGLSSGPHTFTFSDANGCDVDITIVVPAPNCDKFEFSLIESSPSLTQITSNVSATIGVSMNAWCIPDMVEVFVNGIQVLELVAGSGGCNDMDPIYGVYDTFCVSPCDDVEIITTGNICPGEFDCAGSTSTAFDIFISCSLKGSGGNGGSSKSFDYTDNGINSNRELILNKEAIRLKAQESLMVYPNPITNELNITSSDPMVQYQMVRIISSTGRTLHTEDMSSLHQMRIETSAFPEGIYFIEITDTNGNKITDNFIKLN